MIVPPIGPRRSCAFRMAKFEGRLNWLGFSYGHVVNVQLVPTDACFLIVLQKIDMDLGSSKSDRSL